MIAQVLIRNTLSLVLAFSLGLYVALWLVVVTVNAIFM